MSAPVSRTFAALSETMRTEMSGYFTQKVPPKPQQTSESGSSFSVSPATVPSSLRGCALMPSSRRPEQESW